MPYRQFRRCDAGLEPWPPGWEDAFADAFAPLGLTSSYTPNTISDVTPAHSSNALRSQKQLSAGTLKTKFAQVLTKKGVTFAEVVEALRAKLGRPVPRSTVQSWAKPKGDPSYRAIPQDAAEALKELYGVPLGAWPRIIPAP
jgi:hypothetical protein